MRRSVFIGLLFSMAACTLIGAAQPATVTLWNWNIHDKKYQQKMYKLFNERHPEIKIDYSSISNTVYAQVLEASFVGGEPYSPWVCSPCTCYIIYTVLLLS